MSDEIEKLREQIDAFDDALLDSLSRRAALAQRIGELKHDAPAYRAEREAAILRRVADGNPGPLPVERVTAVFREVISACRSLEQGLRVAYLGPEGTFSEQAARKHFGNSVETLPAANIDEVFQRCEAGAVDFAVVPAENSTEGAVGRTLDLLLVTPLRVCGEVELRVRQNLMSRLPDSKAIKRLFSHPQSFAQCTGWLNANLPGAERIPVASNAEAARLASLEPDSGALAGEAAAERYGLALLARGIEDNPNNTTRFLVLGTVEPGTTGRDRTSLVMSVENKPGAVHALLTPLATHAVSMSRIESRPARSAGAGVWEYVFFIDVEGHVSDERVANALVELRKQAPFLKVLGSYPVAVA